MSETRDEAWEQYRTLPLNSDRFTQDQLEQDAFLAGWDAAKADLPDRNEVSKALMLAAGIHGPIATRDERGEIVVNMTPLADAVLALFRGEEPK